MFNVKEKFAQFTTKAGMKIVKHSPEILFGVGCVAFVGTIVLAVKATPKIEKVLEEHNKDLDIARAAAADPEIDNYWEKDLKHDIRVYYRDTFFRVVKIAAPVVACGMVSLGCFGGAQFIVMRRLGAVAAEYTLLQNTFNDYRSRVAKDVGHDKELKYFYGNEEETVKVPVLDEEGNVEEKEEKRIVCNPNPIGYLWCKETSPLCCGIDSTDQLMIDAKISMLNHKFETNRMITECDILGPDGLHMPEVLKQKKDAWMFGKIWDDEHPENNVLVFDCTVGTRLPDYEKAKGDRKVYDIVWKNRELLYNKL